MFRVLGIYNFDWEVIKVTDLSQFHDMVETANLTAIQRTEWVGRCSLVFIE